MEKQTFDSPFDPKWEMSPEEVAKVFSQNTEPDLIPAEDEVATEQDKQLVMFKQLLVQDYLTLLVVIQHNLNSVYKRSEELTKEMYKDQVTALKFIRSNASALFELALKSKDTEDIGTTKLTFHDLARQLTK